MATTTEAQRAPLDPIPLDIWARGSILVIGGFVSMFAATVINVALPALGVAFGATLDQVQWVATSFLIGLAASIPVSGWLARRIGVTKLWLVSLALFTGVSVLCTLAPSLPALIAVRLAQGLIGGVLVPASQMLLGIIAGPKRMGRVASVLGIPIVMGPAVGITLGGFLLQHWGWASLFWVTLPVGLLGLFAGYRWLPRIEASEAGRFDIPGFLLLMLGLPLLSWGVSVLGHDLHSLAAQAAAAAGAILLAIFTLHAARSDAPLLKVTLFAEPIFTQASFIVFAAGFITFGAQLVLPLYYLLVRGESPETTGLLVLPQALGIALALPAGGWLTDRLGGGIVTISGALMAILGTVALALAGPQDADWWLVGVLILRGFGLAMLSMPAYSAVLATLSREDIPNAVPIMNVINRVGGALGTTLLIMIFQLAAGTATPDPQQALTGFSASHWVMAGLLIAALVPAIILRRHEQATRAPKP